LIDHAYELTPAQQRTLFEGTPGNGQLLGSFELGPLIRRLRDSKQIPTDEFDELLDKNGLAGYELL
jgi:hypothetical protein